MSSASNSFIEAGDLWGETNKEGINGEQQMREEVVGVVPTEQAQKAYRSRLLGFPLICGGAHLWGLCGMKKKLYNGARSALVGLMSTTRRLR